jgi:ATP-dependent RNA helicase RhlE
MTQPNSVVPSFNELGIDQNLLTILMSKFDQPTPIQHQVIPVALTGQDIVGIAQTGTGKTLAFGIPLLQKLMRENSQGLILLPTRELALQAEEMLAQIGKTLGLKTAVLIGGASSFQQIQSLRRNPHLIIATPGRLFDHLENRRCSLHKVNMIVLDEADRMLDIGFLPQIKKILKMAPTDRQTLLFSATMPSAIAHIANTYMNDPLRIEVAPAGTSADQINQEVFYVLQDAKMQLLDKMLSDHSGSVLVFSRTKHGAKKIALNVRAMGHASAEIHSNLSPNQRKDSLNGFKTGKYRILIATDIASRGIDVNDISLVINYDLPDNNDDYVHRIGRTGRAGKAGKAVSFASPSQWPDIKAIEKLIRKKITINDTPDLPAKRPLINVSVDAPRFTGGRRGQSSGYRRSSGQSNSDSRPARKSFSRFKKR